MKRFLTAVILTLCVVTQVSAAPAYIVREKDGCAAYLDTKNGIWHKTDCSIRSLPNASDRAILRCGIPAETDVELTRILEDFCS